MNWAAIIWLVLMVVFVCMEANTVTLVSVWFAVGSLGAMLISLLHGPVWLQIVVFFVLAVGTLSLLRPFLRKYIKPKVVKTNVDAVIGSTGYVQQTIDNLSASGQVKLGAMYWTARSTSGEVIPEGTLVKVERIEGVKVFVTPAETFAEAK